MLIENAQKSIKTLLVQRDAARAELDDIKESTKFVMAEDCPADEVHCGCVPILKAELARSQHGFETMFEDLGKAKAENVRLRKALQTLHDDGYWTLDAMSFLKEEP